MENFDQIFTLVAEHEGIGLNLDILETGLINILVLVRISESTPGPGIDNIKYRKDVQ